MIVINKATFENYVNKVKAETVKVASDFYFLSNVQLIDEGKVRKEDDNLKTE